MTAVARELSWVMFDRPGPCGGERLHGCDWAGRPPDIDSAEADRPIRYVMYGGREFFDVPAYDQARIRSHLAS